ncbi:MAG: hypothetical protein M1826_001646, partial [Phylliscum demangeonii]
VRIAKRRVPHPAIASAHAGPSQPKVVYIATHSAFIPAVKRVEKLLAAMDKRRGARAHDEVEVREEVLLKGTNRAIPKVLDLALLFQSRQGCRVRIRTGTVIAVDDVVRREGRAGRSPAPVGAAADDGEGEGGRDQGKGGEEGGGGGGGGGGAAAGVEPASETTIPKTQIRRMSVVEVGICSV